MSGATTILVQPVRTEGVNGCVIKYKFLVYDHTYKSIKIAINLGCSCESGKLAEMCMC